MEDLGAHVMRMTAQLELADVPAYFSTIFDNPSGGKSQFEECK
jgi:hypothetical protein